MTVVDIGCQYRTGTTDTTRTFHWQPSKASTEHKRAFTRVLQGHAAVDMAVFPEGTTGSQIDVLARAPMWQDGRNYTHGTGHGIGVGVSNEFGWDTTQLFSTLGFPQCP